MRNTPFLSDAEDFSLVLGGPLHQLWRRFHAAGPALELAGRRMIGISLIAWLPLLVLTAYQDVAVGHAVPVPFLFDVEAHARLLVGIPLLVVAEVVVHRRIRPVVRHFVEAGIVTPQGLPQFRAAIDRAFRLRNSLAVELTSVVFLFGFGWVLWEQGVALTTSTWYATADAAGWRLTAAGQWYAHVSVPIAQFLLLRWYFRLVVRFLFLLRVSRVDLDLTPTHPDRAGGLGFLSGGPIAFGPVILAQSAVLSGYIGGRILFQGAKLVSFQYEIAAFVILQLALVLGPLCVFAPKLVALKRQGRREYGALAARYTREFHEKWIGGSAPPGEPLVGSGGHPVPGRPGQQLRGGPGHAGAALRPGHPHSSGRACRGAPAAAGAHRGAGGGDPPEAPRDTAVA